MTPSDRAGPLADRTRRVLVVDADPVLAGLLGDVLRDEGYAVSAVHAVRPDVVRAAVDRLEPDCLLLGAQGAAGYGASWADAAWARGRARRVPVVMFTTSRADAEEGVAGASARSRAADFFAVLGKPFDPGELLDAVGRAVGSVVPREPGASRGTGRSAALEEAVRAAGVAEVHALPRPGWVWFRGAGGALVQVLWSESAGAYRVLRQERGEAALRPVGQVETLDAAVALASACG